MPRNRVGRVDILRWHHQANLRDDSDSNDSDSSSSSDSDSDRSIGAVSIHFNSDSDNVNSGEENHSAVHSDSSVSGDSDGQTNNSDTDSAADSDSNSSLLSIQSTNSNNINPAAVESDEDSSVHNTSNNSSVSGDPSVNSDSDDDDDGDAIVSNFSFGSFSSQRSFDGNRIINPIDLNLTFDDSDDSNSNRSRNSSIIGREANNFFELGDLLRNIDRNRPPTPANFGENSEDTDNNNSEENSLEGEAVLFPSRAMTGPSGSRNSAVASSRISYECSVCLENLDQPASIDFAPNAEQEQGAAQDATPPPYLQVRARGGRGGRGGLTQRNVSANLQATVSMNDVVATHCGHLYHQVCLEKWFQEQGRRTCPSCRKSIPKTKNPIRLYPNISMNPGGQQNENANPLINPGGSNSANPSPSTSSGVSSAGGGCARSAGVAENPVVDVDEEGECAKLECQDLKVIHNTLINDYNELQTRVDGLRENDQLQEAQIRSLEFDNNRLLNEIQTLKRQIPVVAATSPVGSGSAPKRRRH